MTQDIQQQTEGTTEDQQQAGVAVESPENEENNICFGQTEQETEVEDELDEEVIV